VRLLAASKTGDRIPTGVKIVGVAILALIIGAIIFTQTRSNSSQVDSGPVAPAASNDPAPVATTGDVTLTVTGDAADASITYDIAGAESQVTDTSIVATPSSVATMPATAPSGTSEYQQALTGTSTTPTTVTIPASPGWTQDTKANTGDALVLSAQGDANTTTITCTVSEDGKTIQTATSSGAFATCSASGVAN
jgi:hypothetical protein